MSLNKKLHKVESFDEYQLHNLLLISSKNLLCALYSAFKNHHIYLLPNDPNSKNQRVNCKNAQVTVRLVFQWFIVQCQGEFQPIVVTWPLRVNSPNTSFPLLNERYDWSFQYFLGETMEWLAVALLFTAKRLIVLIFLRRNSCLL